MRAKLQCQKETRVRIPYGSNSELPYHFGTLSLLRLINESSSIHPFHAFHNCHVVMKITTITEILFV